MDGLAGDVARVGAGQERTELAELVDLVEQATPETAKSQDYRQRQFVQPKEVRLAAATALAKMGYRDGLYVAEQFRADEDPAVRAQAAFLFAAGARTRLESERRAV
jgi:HEAT repeat protein